MFCEAGWVTPSGATPELNEGVGLSPGVFVGCRIKGPLGVNPGVMEALGVGEFDAVTLGLAPIDSVGVADMETVDVTDTEGVTVGGILEVEGVGGTTEVVELCDGLGDGAGMLADELEEDSGTFDALIEADGLVLALAELDGIG